MALMIPRVASHDQRAAYNLKHGAGAYAAHMATRGAPAGMAGNPTPRPIAPGMANPDPRPMAPGVTGPSIAPSGNPGVANPVITPMTGSASPSIPVAAPAAAASPNAMLLALHKADPKTLSQRFNPAQLQAAYAKLKGGGQQTAAAPAAPAAPAPAVQTAPAPVPETPAAGAPAGLSPEMVNAMFPTTRMFEPQNYQGSPLYQFQVKAGEDQVNKSLAKRGLANSGAGIREELNVPMMAAAQDTERMTRLASENANRLQNYQQAESLRQERTGNAQWDRGYSLAQLMAEQSPWQGALAGLNGSVDATGAAGQSQANFLKDYYKRILGGGGGGGIPMQLPSGPNYSGITPAQINGNTSSNNGWMNLLTQGLSSFF